MKKIGKDTLILKTGPKNPRNGESTFIRLKDGSILLVYSQYCGDDPWDDGTARLAACRSEDEGKTWSAPWVIVEKDPEAQNYMSPSLIRLPNGELGMTYLRKAFLSEKVLECMPVFRYSADEGRTWSDYRFCTPVHGYYCGVNDCAIVTKAGRILYPASDHGPGAHTETGSIHWPEYPGGVVRVFFSDDSGRTWDTLPGPISSPYPDAAGFAEPGIFELEDGTLWVWMRSTYGHQYQSISKDGGKTWSPASPAFRFTSADSPMRVKPAGGHAVAVFNPQAFSCLYTAGEIWKSPKRTPLVCAVSRDGGASFAREYETFVNGGLLDFAACCYMLEDDPKESFCYPAVIETKDGFLVTYYYSGGNDRCLNWTKVKKVLWEELEA